MSVNDLKREEFNHLLTLATMTGGEFEKRTATQLWADGLDYGEDEAHGRTLEELVHVAYMPRGAHSLVRVSWWDEKDQAHNVCLHTHYLDDTTPAPPECVCTMLEIRFLKV